MILFLCTVTEEQYSYSCGNENKSTMIFQTFKTRSEGCLDFFFLVWARLHK